MYVNVMSIIHDSANFYFHGLTKFMITDMYFYGIICTNVLSIFVFRYWFLGNLTKVRPLFTLLHIGYDNTLLLIIFSAYYVDQSFFTFMRLKVG